MLISPHHKFVFICTPKCASTAIEDGLAPYSGVKIGGTPQLKHATFAEYQRHIAPFLGQAGGVNPASLTVLALMREPMDWLASWWRYRARAALKNPKHPNHRNYTGDMSFEQFLDRYFGEPGVGLLRQHHHVADATGGFDGIEIYRYEEMGRFVDRISSLIGRKIAFDNLNVSPTRRTHDVAPRYVEMLAEEYDVYNRL